MVSPRHMGLLAKRTTWPLPWGTSTTAGFSAISLPPVIMPLRSKSFSAAKRRTTRGTSCTFVGPAPTTWAAEIAADGDDGTGAKINIKLIVVAVGDGAFFVVNGGKYDAAGGLHGAGIGNVHHFGHAAGDGERSAGLHGDEQAAFADEALQIGEALIAEAAADVVGGVQTGGYKVGSFGGVFPWPRVASHGQAAQDSAQSCRAASTHRRKNDDVKLFAEVLGFAQPSIGDVGVGDFQFLHGNAEPAVVLSVLPIVDEGEAGRGEWVSLDVQGGVCGMDFDSEIFGGFFELGAIGVANHE